VGLNRAGGPVSAGFLGKSACVLAPVVLQGVAGVAPQSSIQPIIMTSLKLSLVTSLLLAGSSVAQSPNLLVSFSDTERTASGSGGTVLQQLFRNEMAFINFGACTALSAEKWMPRSCAHVMAGDEDANGNYWNPGVFGDIDAVLTHRHSMGTGADENQRSIFWSVAAPMGGAVSASPFRPGDVGRIMSNGFVHGQVQHFMNQEQFNIALGRAPSAPLDIDAIAWQPNFGIWFSIDNTRNANTACGPVVLQDGDVLCIPPSAINYTSDGRVAAVMPSSVEIVYSEAQIDAFTLNANVADNLGGCVSVVGDVEGLEIDLFGPMSTFVTCSGMTIGVPTLLFTGETGSGASILTTNAGGQIQPTPCGLAGQPCGIGPTTGSQVGLRAPVGGVGVASHITGLGFAYACTHTLEADMPMMPVSGVGSPLGFSQIHYNSPFGWNVVLIELVPAFVPPAVTGLSLSPTCFPDLYAPSINSYAVVAGGFGSIPMPAIPASFVGKVLFQSVGLGAGSFEFSTPTVVDVF